MKKVLVMSVMVGMIAAPAIACDVCGSGTGSAYMGLLPDFKKRFIGLRYQYSSLQNHLGANGQASYLTATERFHTTELWSTVSIGKKFRVAVFIPYHFISRENAEARASASGIGDITTVGFYQLLSKQKSKDKKLLAHSLWLGAGIKFATGNYSPEDKNAQQSGVNTFQLGTGSHDFSFHAIYDISINRIGLNVNAAYKVNTANRYQYQYGNKFTLNTLAYYRLNPGKKITVTPNAGILWETAGKDHKQAGITVWETGGYSLMGIAGLEFGTGGVSMGMNLQSPFCQYLGEGKAKANPKAMVYVAVNL